MKQHHPQLILIATLLVTLTACTKRVQRTVHESEKNLTVSEETKSPNEKISAEQVEKFKKIDTALIYAEVKQANSGTDHLNVSLKILDLVSEDSVLRNTETAHSDKFKTLIGYLNFSVLKAFELSPSDESGLELLNRYVTLITSGCNLQLQFCQNTTLFAQDSKSTRILFLKIRSIENSLRKLKSNSDKSKERTNLVKHYYRLLKVAYDLKNRQKDEDLDFQYVLYARSYAEILHAENSGEGKELLEQHGRVFQEIIQSFPIDYKDPRFKQFLTDFKPWTFSHQQGGIFPYGLSKIFEAAATSMLYDSKKSQLSTEFKKTVLEIQTVPDNFGLSFKQTVKTLVANRPQLLKTLGISTENLLKDEFFDEYFYMIDRLFRNHLEPSEAMQIWNASAKNSETLNAKYETYLKIYVVSALAYSIDEMKKIYLSNASDSENMVKLVLEGGQYISNEWTRVLNSGKATGNFMRELLSRQNGQEKRVKDSRDLEASIDRNLKYLAVFPNMMLLAYFMSEKEAKIFYTTWWGQKIEIEAAKVITALFSGELSSWFRMGNTTDDGISKYELNYAFHFGVVSGLFEAFKGVKKLDGVTPILTYDSYIKVILQKYLSGQLEALDKAIQELKTYTQTNTNFLNSLEYCQAEQLISEKKLTEYKLKQENFFALKSHLLTGIGETKSNESPSVNSFLNVIYDDITFGIRSVIEDIRLDMNPKLNQIKMMADIIELNLSAINEDEATKKELLKSVRAQVEVATQKQKVYLDLAVKTHRSISKCVNQAFDRELKIRQSFYQFEIDRLGKIYDLAIPHIKQNVDEQGLQSATKSGQDLWVEPQSDKLDHLSVDGYHYNELNFYLRTAKWLDNAKPISIDMTFPLETLNRLDSYNKTVLIPFKNTSGQIVEREAFIKSALRYINGSTESFVFWANNAIGLNSKLSKIDGMIQLMKSANDLDIAADKRVNAKEIMQEIHEVFNHASISKDDAVLLNWLSRDRKISREELARIFDIESDEKATPMEKLYIKLVKNTSTYGWTGMNDVYFGEAREFFDFASKSWYYLFRPSIEIDRKIRGYFVPMIENTERLKAEVDSALLSLESSKDLPDVWYFRVEEGQLIGWKPHGFQDRRVLLSLEKRKSLDLTIKEFHRETGNYFKSGTK